jgi:flagellar hook-associated protein 1 FlgK
MAGLNDVLNLSASGLNAYQSQINVYGNNIANVDTDGYSRQTLNLETAYTSNGFGTGVQSGDVSRLYNSLGQSALLQEQPTAGYHTELASCYSDLTSLLGGGNDALNEAFSSFQSALQDAIASPEDLAARTVLLQSASTLSTEINQVDSMLANAGSLWDTPADMVDGINDLTSQLQTLNQDIYTAEAMNKSVPDMLDQRDQLVSELAQYVNVSVSPDYQVTLGDQELVSFDGQSRQELAVDDTYTFSVGGTDVTDSVTSGKLAAVVVALDTADSLRGQLDTLASTLISDVNGVFDSAYNLNGERPTDLDYTFFTGSTAGDIAVDTTLYDPTDPMGASPGLLALASTRAAVGVANAGDNTAGQAIYDVLQATSDALGGQSIADYWTQVEATLAGAYQEESVLATSSSATVAMFENQMLSVSGVSLDEELTNLMSAEKAYQACARLMSTASDLLDTLINLGR